MIQGIPAEKATLLIEQAKQGNQPAFEELFFATHRQIYNFLLAQGLGKNDAEDLCQETYINAWRSLPGLRSNETFVAWLHQIARNLARDRGRRASRAVFTSISENEHLEASQNDLPENLAEAHEVEDALRKSLESLPTDQRVPIVMHHLEGMAVADIAIALGSSQGTIMSRMARGRVALTRKLAHLISPPPRKGAKNVLQD